MAAVIPFVMLAASAVSAQGQMAAGTAANKAAQDQAALERQQGTEAIEQADVRAQLTGQQVQKLQGQQRANYGAGGVDPNSGSALDVQKMTASEGELSRKLIQYQGHVQQLSNTGQASLDVYQGEAQQIAGQYAAAGTLLTGAGKAGYSYFNPGS